MMRTGKLKRALAAILPSSWLATRGKSDTKALALTFDDGPHQEYTPRVLELLGKHGAKATFFFIGENIERHPALVKRVVDEGHQLGNHSYSHGRDFARLPLAAQLAEIERTDAMLERFDGRALHPFRPPRGELPLALLLALVRRRQSVTMWSYDSLDSRGLGATSTLRRFTDEPVRRGDIVLMHDDNAHTLEALQGLLPVWQQQGWSPVALTSLGVG
jgi:peptidoglycan/xylan/chitin deacetylase (PgdA/CDA1 family)